MRPDLTLWLGDFAFSGFEIPERIAFGGEQRANVHELVGGVRVVDAMGRSDAPLEWSGIFFGENADTRAMYLDALRIAGTVQRLRWHLFDYQVIVKSFSAQFERKYQIPYRISCLVVADNASPVTFISTPGIDAAIADDMNGAATLGDAVGDGPLSTALATLDGAIKAVSSFAGAAQSTINTVLAPLAAVQSRVAILVAAVGNTMGNVTTIGGVLPNNPIAQTAAKLSGQVAAFTQLPLLLNLQAVTGRMGANLGSISAPAQTVTAAGGNLFKMAGDAYGDATAWTGIARANGIVDPMLAGINTVKIPRVADTAGGVLTS